MYKIAAVGDHDSISGFAAVGLDIFPEENAGKAGATIHSLARNGYGVIYVTEALVSLLSAELERYKYEKIPIIVPIPGVTGNTGIGMRRVTEFVEKAVGSDILSDGSPDDEKV